VRVDDSLPLSRPGRIKSKRKGKSHPLPSMQFPLRLRDLHEQLLILDRNPARKHLHRIFEVAVEEDLPGAVDERRRSSVQDVETAAEGPIWRRCDGGIGIAKEHEDVPDAELRREGDGVIEEGQVPTGSIGRGLDAEFSLRALARFRGEKGIEVLRVSWILHHRQATACEIRREQPLVLGNLARRACRVL
jgi:hypothetical protein